MASIVFIGVYETKEICTSCKQYNDKKRNQQKDAGKSLDKYLTREETAKLCKVNSLSTLWNWNKQGLLVPTSRAGRKPLYKYEDVIEFLHGSNITSDDK